jgi:hypothetical protein
MPLASKPWLVQRLLRQTAAYDADTVADLNDDGEVVADYQLLTESPFGTAVVAQLGCGTKERTQWLSRTYRASRQWGL